MELSTTNSLLNMPFDMLKYILDYVGVYITINGFRFLTLIGYDLKFVSKLFRENILIIFNTNLNLNLNKNFNEIFDLFFRFSFITDYNFYKEERIKKIPALPKTESSIFYYKTDIKYCMHFVKNLLFDRLKNISNVREIADYFMFFQKYFNAPDNFLHSQQCSLIAYSIKYNNLKLMMLFESFMKDNFKTCIKMYFTKCNNIFNCEHDDPSIFEYLMANGFLSIEILRNQNFKILSKNARINIYNYLYSVIATIQTSDTNNILIVEDEMSDNDNIEQILSLFEDDLLKVEIFNKSHFEDDIIDYNFIKSLYQEFDKDNNVINEKKILLIEHIFALNDTEIIDALNYYASTKYFDALSLKYCVIFSIRLNKQKILDIILKMLNQYNVNFNENVNSYVNECIKFVSNLKHKKVNEFKLLITKLNINLFENVIHINNYVPIEILHYFDELKINYILTNELVKILINSADIKILNHIRTKSSKYDISMIHFKNIDILNFIKMISWFKQNNIEITLNDNMPILFVKLKMIQ
jgi:hypothetical protein